MLCQRLSPRFARQTLQILIHLPASDTRRKRYSMMKRITAPLLPALILSACAAPQGEFPSLLRRPYETKAPITAPVPPENAVLAVLPADLRAKAEALAARHRAAQIAYRDLLPQSDNAARAASGTAVGSEAWVSAHLQVSRLDKARADSKAALAEIDRMITAQMNADIQGNSPDIAALLMPYQNRLATDTAAQDAEIERLSALIGV